MHCRCWSSDQLRAKTNTEYRYAAIHRAPYRLYLEGQVRELRVLIDVHRTAQHDQTVVLFNLGSCLRVTGKIDVANTKATVFQHRMEDPEDFEGNVLKNQQATHRTKVTLPEPGLKSGPGV